MKTELTLVVAIEDISTIRCVGKEAAHVAMEIGATRIVLLHVLDQHPLSGAAVAMSGYYFPVAEPPEEGSTLLQEAQAAVCAEFDREGIAVPEMDLLVGKGMPSMVIEEVIKSFGAGDVVLGARHHHLLGSLVYGDVRAHLKCLDARHVHVAALEALSGKGHV